MVTIQNRPQWRFPIGSGYSLQSFLPEKGQKRISTAIPNAKKSPL